MSSCLIQFDNYQSQYYPGYDVSGRLICSFNSPKTVRAIKVRLKCEERNEWTKSEQYYDENEKKHKTRHVQCTGYNIILNMEQTLTGQEEFNSGRHEFPFSFHLPNNIPGTYHGQFGGVFFCLQAKVDRPFKSDYTDTKQFIVVSPINLEEMKEKLQLEPLSYSDEKTLCCCCCASDPITMEVHLEKEAFIVGEVINIRVDITNMSNESIESLDIKLGSTVESKVTSPSRQVKSDYELLATCHDSGVGAHGQRTYNIGLEIPQSAVANNFHLCTLFRQRAKMEVVAVIDSWYSDMEIPIDVTIGHIPPRNLLDNQAVQQPALQSYTPINPPPLYPPSQNPVPYPVYNSPGFPTPQLVDTGNVIGFVATSEPSAPPLEDVDKKSPLSRQEGLPPSYNEAGFYPPPK